MSKGIDVLVPSLTNPSELFRELKAGLVCINKDKTKEMIDLLETNHSIRFVEKGMSTPNIELRYTENRFHQIAYEPWLIIGKHHLTDCPSNCRLPSKGLYWEVTRQGGCSAPGDCIQGFY